MNEAFEALILIPLDIFEGIMPLYLYIFINNYPKRCTHVQVVTWQALELMMHDALVFLQLLGTVARVQRNRIFLICHRHAVLGNCSIVNC